MYNKVVNFLITYYLLQQLSVYLLIQIQILFKSRCETTLVKPIFFKYYILL